MRRQKTRLPIERSRLELAIADYAHGALNLGEAAAQAGVNVARMLAELDARGIDTIGPAHFRGSLSSLTDLFGASDELRAALTEREK
jgi:hypothetical protein